MSTLKVNAIQGTNGVERYLARAWVNFNGSGTVAIRASGNVSSVTDNGTGNFTVNFTSAMPDANYAAHVACGGASSGSAFTYHGTVHSRATGSCGVNTTAYNVGTVLSDSEDVHFSLFR